MSQIETNPLLTPTSITNKPNQEVEHLPTILAHDFSTYNPYNRHVSAFLVPQTDWVSIAATEKYFSELTWDTSSLGELMTLEFDFKSISDLIPIGLDFNSYANLDTVLITIHKTDNAFYQGALVIAFDPSPDPNFYKDFYRLDLKLDQIWQFPKVILNPKTSGDIVLSIPLNIPFEMFRLGDSQFAKWFKEYSFGRLRFYVMDKLATKSPSQSLSYAIQGNIVNFATSGLNFSTPAPPQ